MQERCEKILGYWGLKDIKVLNNFDVGGLRLVCKVQTEQGVIILKGQPVDVNEKSIMGNIQAHEYLGNKNNMAPKLLSRPDGSLYLKDTEYYYYIMEFITGRHLLETVEDEYLLGRAVGKMHSLAGHKFFCTFDVREDIQQFRSFYKERKWKNEFDTILDELLDFYKYRQCFIHTDIGPHNLIINENGKVIFIDLDDAGIGPQYIDIGWPFISQFVDFNRETKEMHYKFDIATSFLKGYCSVRKVTEEEYNLIWSGAVYTHIFNMQWFGVDAAESLWKILKYGMSQKEELKNVVLSLLSK